MVKQTPKVISNIVTFLALALLTLTGVNPVFADTPYNATFQVNVKETISVSITRPSSGATGGVGDFLRNDFAINVVSNNTEGFTASMYADIAGNTVPLTNTSLSSAKLPTLTNSSGIARSSFPANYWGYTLGQYTLDGTVQNSYTLSGKTYSETAAGNDSSNYYPMINSSASPIVIMDGATSPKRTGTQNIYFGAKGDNSTASGTYTGTVIVSVVSGGIDNNNPITPTNPDTPSDDTPNDNAATYTGSTGTGATQGVGKSGTTGTTVYTTTSGNTTTTEISGGDNRSAYAGPQGERYETFTNVTDGSLPVTGLVMASSVAAVTGFTFFIFAYRDDDDDDDEEENGATNN